MGGFIILVTHQYLRSQVPEPLFSGVASEPCSIWHFNHAQGEKFGSNQANETETKDKCWNSLHIQVIISQQGSLTVFAFQIFQSLRSQELLRAKMISKGAGFLAYETAVSTLCPKYLSMKLSSVIVDLCLDVHGDEGHTQQVLYGSQFSNIYK